MRPVFRRPVKASGAQIGRHTRSIVTCLTCLSSPTGMAAKTACPVCSDPLVRFDSSGEWKCWLTLVNAKRSGLISSLERQVRMPLIAEGGTLVGKLVMDFVFERDGKTVYGDYKGGAMTELAMWKMRHFKAQYGVEVTIFGGK